MAIISVIVPVFKVEKYLNKCVKSILEQSFADIEVILVDDGSPDKCPELCDKWAEDDNRIKVIHKQNGGLSDARNKGIEAASGRYVAFIDSDDWIHKDFLMQLYQVMEQNRADIVECGTAFVDESDVCIRERKCENPVIELSKIEALERLILEKGVYQTVWNKLYKSEVIKNIPFETGKWHEDDFWTYQVFEKCEKVVVLQDVLYRYLQRTASIMGNGYTLKRLDGLEAHIRRKEYLKKYRALYVLCERQLWYECLYHLQCIHKWLKGSEKKTAAEVVERQIRKLDRAVLYEGGINIKYKIWFGLFENFPNATARIRNLIKVGI